MLSSFLCIFDNYYYQILKTKTITILIFVIFIVSCSKKTKISNDELLILKDTAITNTNIKTLDNLYYKILQSNNDSVNRNLLFTLANKYFDISKPYKYFEIASKINELAISQNDSAQIAKSYNYIGYYYNNSTKLDSAFKYYLKAEKIYKAIGDNSNYAKLKMYKSRVYYDIGNLIESEIEAINALKLIKKENYSNPSLVYQCYLTIALSLNEMSNYPKSLEYFNLALNQIKILEKNNSFLNSIPIYRATCYNSKGRIYVTEKKYNLAIEFYNKALEDQSIKKLDPILYAMILSNLAYAKLKTNNINGVKKMLFESYKIRDSIDSNAGRISSKYKIGEYYLYQKDTTKALENILSCYTLSKKVKSNPDVLNSLKLLTEIDTKNKNFYAGEYFRVSDSLQQAERATRNKFARIEFETDQVEKENQLLSKKNTYIITGTIVLLSIAGVFFMLYRLKTKNKELKLIQVQQNKNEEIYKLLLNQQSISEESRKEERNRISKELHDGVVNSIFTTRFNLMQLEPSQSDKKNQLVKELEKTELEIRRVSHELNKNLDFNDDSIVKMLNDLVKAQKNEWNTKFTISVDKLINWNTIDSETKMNIYRIIQEILQNVNKYAKAKQCIVMILKTNKKTTIRIWDNGIGFNPEKVKKGIGLKNIQDRAAAINGALNINSNDNNGTNIEIEF